MAGRSILIVDDEALVPVCAPDLGPLTSMADLVCFALLHRSADQQAWIDWLAQ